MRGEIELEEENWVGYRKMKEVTGYFNSSREQRESLFANVTTGNVLLKIIVYKMKLC